MHFTLTNTVTTALCALATLGFSSCSPEHGSRENSTLDEVTSEHGPPGDSLAVADVAIQTDGPRNKDCWWQSSDGHSLVAVWLSPRLKGELRDGFRFTNIVFHDPSLRSPLALLGGIARLATSDPIAMDNGTVKVVAKPLEGLTWRDVVTRDDLSVAVMHKKPPTAKVTETVGNR